jgi:hypothetical protein
VVVFCTVTCVEDSRGFFGGAAEADDTMKLAVPKNSPTKTVTTTAVVMILKLAFIAVTLICNNYKK